MHSIMISSCGSGVSTPSSYVHQIPPPPSDEGGVGTLTGLTSGRDDHCRGGARGEPSRGRRSRGGGGHGLRVRPALLEGLARQLDVAAVHGPREGSDEREARRAADDAADDTAQER